DPFPPRSPWPQYSALDKAAEEVVLGWLARSSHPPRNAGDRSHCVSRAGAADASCPAIYDSLRAPASRSRPGAQARGSPAGIAPSVPESRVCPPKFGLGALDEIVARHSSQPSARVKVSSRLAAFTVEPITANSRQVSPMSPSTTGP